MKILASGPSGPATELDPLRAAGHEVVIGRPLDQPGRAAYTERDLGAAARDAHVILASHLDAITREVMDALMYDGLTDAYESSTGTLSDNPNAEQPGGGQLIDQVFRPIR